MKGEFEHKMYYLLLFSLGFFLAFLTYFMTPIFFLGGFLASLVACFIGLGLGWFIAIFMKEIDALTKHHHASLLLVVIICSSVFFSTMNVDYISNPLLISSIFSISFLLPYAYIHR